MSDPPAVDTRSSAARSGVRLKGEQLEELVSSSHFDRDEILALFSQFRGICHQSDPSGGRGIADQLAREDGRARS